MQDKSVKVRWPLRLPLIPVKFLQEFFMNIPKTGILKLLSNIN